MLSVIVPVKGQKELVQVCLDSLDKYTDNYDLIIVDNSPEEKMQFPNNALVITNEKPNGWCKSINQGLEHCNGDYAVFSNSDVGFTPEWSQKMIAHFEDIPTLGVLGPTSNQVNGRQHMSFNRPNETYESTDFLMFFCVMIKKEVIGRIGGLDERFDPGGQDDADYCKRALDAGFEVGIARDTFLYHYGSATFREEFGFDAPKSRKFASSRQKLLEEKHSSPYTTEYFKMYHDGALSSAQAVVPKIMETVNPSCVLDIGCGQGEWLSVFSKYVIGETHGIDGNFESEKITRHDLTTPLFLDRRYDLVISLEVAEHLPESAAKTFVETLCYHSDVVLFSAAIPNQGGTRHVNEKWPEYWAKLFRDAGYLTIDCLRDLFWGDERVLWWYAQNMLIFIKEEVIDKYPALMKYEVEAPKRMVHPIRYEQTSNKAPVNNKVQKVFIGIPTSGSNIVPGLVQNLIYWSHHPSIGIRLPITIPEGLFPLDNARNQIVKEFLEHDYEYIWWIDDDIVPPPQTMERLVSILDSRPDISAIGATCFSMRSENGMYFPYPVTLRYNEERKYVAYYGNGIEEVDAVGGACVMVRKEVYESIPKPYEFLYHPDGSLRLTCDFVIWQKFQERGFKLFVDFDTLCDHQKKCSIKGFQDQLSYVQKTSMEGKNEKS